MALELSERCEAWQHEWCVKLHSDLGLSHGVCKGCQVNLRNSQGVLMCKGWGISSNWGPFVQHMSLSCDGRHARARCEGKDSRASAFYTDVFAKRVCAFLAASDQWREFALEANQAGLINDGQHVTLETAWVNEGEASEAPPEGEEEPAEAGHSGRREAKNLPEFEEDSHCVRPLQHGVSYAKLA